LRAAERETGLFMSNWHFLLLSPVGVILWVVLGIVIVVLTGAVRPRWPLFWVLNGAIVAWVVALVVQGAA
jgi:hypothetical protein